MREPPPSLRIFTIADGMILVAATALALVDLDLDQSAGDSSWDRASPRLTWACMAFTFALVPIRLRRPRPDRDDLWRQPGWIACFSVSIVLGITLALEGWRIARFTIKLQVHGPSLAYKLFFPRTLASLPFQACLMVIAAWLVLALGGRWKAEPRWVDRAGRLIGCSWVAISLPDWAFFR